MAKITRIHRTKTDDRFIETDDGVSHHLPDDVCRVTGWWPGNGHIGTEYPFIDGDGDVAAKLQPIEAFKLVPFGANRRAVWEALSAEEKGLMAPYLSTDELAEFAASPAALVAP